MTSQPLTSTYDSMYNPTINSSFMSDSRQMQTNRDSQRASGISEVHEQSLQPLQYPENLLRTRISLNINLQNMPQDLIPPNNFYNNITLNLNIKQIPDLSEATRFQMGNNVSYKVGSTT